MSRPKSIAIVGTGAVGGFYGSRLHHPNPPVGSHSSQVSLICRSNYPAVSRQKGLRLQTHTFGSYDFTAHAVYSSVTEASTPNADGTGRKWDFVIVTSKALPDISDDSSLIEPLVAPGENGTVIVLIQNGVGVEEPYRKRFPKNVIVSGVTVISAVQPEPGLIVQNRWTRINLGPYIHGSSSSSSDDSLLCQRSDESTSLLASLMQQGGIKDADACSESYLQMIRWHKLAINASMNPSSVLTYGANNSRMALDPELRRHLKSCMDEILETAPKVLGEPFPPELLAKSGDPERILRSSERNTEGKPSMLVDWEKGNRMELEVILGNPVRIARNKGIEMPRLQTLYALLRMAQDRRDEERERQKSPKL